MGDITSGGATGNISITPQQTSQTPKKTEGSSTVVFAKKSSPVEKMKLELKITGQSMRKAANETLNTLKEKIDILGTHIAQTTAILKAGKRNQQKEVDDIRAILSFIEDPSKNTEESKRVDKLTQKINQGLNDEAAQEAKLEEKAASKQEKIAKKAAQKSQDKPIETSLFENNKQSLVRKAGVGGRSPNAKVSEPKQTEVQDKKTDSPGAPPRPSTQAPSWVPQKPLPKPPQKQTEMSETKGTPKKNLLEKVAHKFKKKEENPAPAPQAAPPKSPMERYDELMAKKSPTTEEQAELLTLIPKVLDSGEKEEIKPQPEKPSSSSTSPRSSWVPGQVRKSSDQNLKADAPRVPSSSSKEKLEKEMIERLNKPISKKDVEALQKKAEEPENVVTKNVKKLANMIRPEPEEEELSFDVEMTDADLKALQDKFGKKE